MNRPLPRPDATGAAPNATSYRGAVFDLPGFIDSQRIGRGQVLLLLTCAAVLFVDGFDTQAIAYVAPAVAREWGLPRGGLGPVFSASLFGLMLGALLLGPLADRIGRKRIIVLSTLAFGIGTLATIFAGGTGSLLVIRFLTGLGLGGAMPNVVAMTAEFSPHRRRATMVMIMFCGFSIGAALGGLIAAALIPAFGWRSVFLVGGAVPLLLSPALALRLPESVRFLALSGRADARIAAILTRLFPGQPVPPGTRFGTGEPSVAGIPVLHLFQERRSAVTLLFWVVFFMNLLDLYFLSSWLPTVINDLGASVSVSAMVGALLQVGGVAGALVLGRVIDRFSFHALALTYLGAAFAIVALGMATHSIGLAAVAVSAAGFCIVGGQTASNGLVATFYPTSIRSTGVGWALGVGRIGSIIGPLVGGALLALRWDAQPLFLAASVPALCAAAAAWALARAAARQAPEAGRGPGTIITKTRPA